MAGLRVGAAWRTLEAHGCPLEDRRSDAAAVLKKLLHDGGVGQGGNVAQVPLVAGDLTEHPPHYLPWEGGGRERDRKASQGGRSVRKRPG